MKEKTLRFESLEPRLLLSADLVGSTFDSEHGLVLEDADGTRVTFELSGPGSGAVVADGGAWDVALINPDAQTSFSVKAQGGDGRVVLDDIHVAGAINSIDAPQAHLTGTLAMEGALGAGLLIGSASDALIATPSLGLNFFGFNLGGIIVLGDLENTELLIGADLGADGQLGGSAAAADAFGPGSITLLAVLGSVTDSMVRAGQDPVNGAFDDCDDLIHGGADSSIGFVLLGGELSADSRIIAGTVPDWALVHGRLIPTAGDPRFKTDVHGPEVELALANDSGASASDGVTVDPSIAGSVADASGIVGLRAGFGGAADVDISDKLAADGAFLLSRSDLEQIHGGTLDDGSYTLTLEAEDGQGNACPHTISFTLDSTSPTVTINQAPGQEDPTRGDLIQFTVDFSEAVTGFDAADVSFAGSTAGSEFVAEVTGSGTNYAVSVTGMNGSGVVVISVPAAAATDAAGNASLAATISDNSVTFGPNLPPVAEMDVFTVPAGHPTLITFEQLLENDEDPDGDALRVAFWDTRVLDVIGGLEVATVHVEHDPLDPENRWLVVTPAPDFPFFVGTARFDYTITDGFGRSDDGAVIISYVNQPPVAGDDSYSVDEDAVLTVAMPGLLSNDTDAESAALTAALDTGPANGSVVVNPDGSFTYTPRRDFNGSDSFTYRVSDGDQDAIGNVSLTVNAVNDAPVAGDDSYSVDEDAVLTVTMPVLVNDTDVDSAALTVALETGPAHGSLTFNADGSFTYRPNPDFSGSDSFTYRVSDGDRDDIGLVSITVNAVNDAPIAADDAYMTDEDTVLTVAMPGALGNDTDIDSAALAAILETGPAHGTLTLNADGSFSYTPELDFNGTDSFTYRVSDGDRDDTALVEITVNAVNDAPVAGNDSYSVDEDAVLTVAMPAVLGNDSDVDSAVLTAALETGPMHGSLVLNADGSFSYTPNPDFSGSDSFSYRASDGDRDHTGLVSITVNAVKDAPVAASDVFVDRPGNVATITFADLVRNDTDADGDALSVVGVLGLAVDANGFPVANVLTDPVTRTIRVVPRPEFPFFTGEVRFLYTVADGSGGFAAAQVTIDYRNAAPVADADFFTSHHGQEKVISFDDLLGGDTDADGDVLHVVQVDSTVSDLIGNVVADATVLGQLIVVTPRPEFASFIGAARFSYRVEDGFGGSGVGQATIDYINEAPMAGDDAFTVPPGVSSNIAFWELLADDTDPDGDGLTVVGVEGEVRDAAGNVVALVTIDEQLQQLTVTPTPEFASFSGVATFHYRIADGFGGEDVGEVAINYTNNQPPMSGEHFFDMPAGSGGEITFADLLLGDIDPNGDPLEVVSSDSQVVDVMGNVVATVQFDRDHGRLVVTPTPEFISFTGAARFGYRITDPFGGTADGVITIIFAEAGTPAVQTALVQEQDPLPTVEALVTLADLQPVQHGGFVDPAPRVDGEFAEAGNGAWAVVALSPMGWVLQRRLAPAARGGVDWSSKWRSGPLPLAPKPGRGNFAEFSEPARAR